MKVYLAENQTLIKLCIKVLVIDVKGAEECFVCCKLAVEWMNSFCLS